MMSSEHEDLAPRWWHTYVPRDRRKTTPERVVQAFTNDGRDRGIRRWVAYVEEGPRSIAAAGYDPRLSR